MIKVELEPTRLIVDEPTELAVSLTNIGPGACTGVLFTVQLPVELALLRGKRQCRVPCLDEHQTHVHRIQVQARQIGTWVLRSASFSYRDTRGAVVQAPRVEIPLLVEAPRRLEAVNKPVVKVAWEASDLFVNRWGGLHGQVSNVGQVPIGPVTVSAQGPLTCTPVTIPTLPPGALAPFVLKIRPTEAGSMVPVTLQVTYEFGSGQEDGLTVEGALNVEEAIIQTGPIHVQGDLLQPGAKKVEGDEISGYGQKGDRVEIRREGPTGPAPTASFCHHCSERLRPGSRFCHKCGEMVVSK